MKNIKSIFTAIVFALILSGCSLKEQSYSKVDMSEYFQNANQAEPVLMGVYKEMCNASIYGQNLSLIFELPTDEAKVNGNSLVGARQEASNAYLATDSFVQNTWGALYEAIFRANSFIENLGAKISGYEEKDQKAGNVMLAEAKCLRALFYFELVRRFGNIPLMISTEQSKQHPKSFKQANPVDVYKFIEKDLKEAVEILPWASEDGVRASNAFRFSKGGALGLLTKVYATWAGYPLQDTDKWEDAMKTAETLVSSGKHSLLPDYEQLWKNSGAGTWDATESLIEVSFYAQKATSGMNGYIGKWNGVVSERGSVRSGFNIALTSVMPVFIQEWIKHPDDKRCALSYADFRYVNPSEDYPTGIRPIMEATIDKVKTTVTFPMACDETTYGWKIDWRRYFSYNLSPRKFDNQVYVPDSNLLVDDNLSNQNWYLLRYADVLLLYAEILNEYYDGPTAEAYECINMVRRRAYGQDIHETSLDADLPWGLSYVEFQTAVRKERSYEMCFEGQRRMDLMRWGNYYETIWDTYEKLGEWNEIAQSYLPAIEYTIKGKTELMPIPQREIDLCGYKQNPGW